MSNYNIEGIISINEERFDDRNENHAKGRNVGWSKRKVSGEKDSFPKIVEDVKKFKSDVDKAMDFMNTKFELVMNESK